MRFLALLSLWISAVSCMHVRSALGCIKDFFCVKTLDPSRFGEFCPVNKVFEVEGRYCEYELIGFMATPRERILKMENEVPAFQIGARSTLLGEGVYVADRFATAEMDAKQFFKKPAVCSVYAPKTKLLNSWLKIYVPPKLRVERYFSHSEFPRSEYLNLHLNSDDLKEYMKELKKTNVEPEQYRSDRSPILISRWQYIEGRNYVGGGYFMMIPESKAQHLRVHCAQFNKREQTTGLTIDLKWEQKSIEEWKVSNFDKPMDILMKNMETGEKSLTSSKNWVTPAQKEQLERSARNAAQNKR